ALQGVQVVPQCRHFQEYFAVQASSCEPSLDLLLLGRAEALGDACQPQPGLLLDSFTVMFGLGKTDYFAQLRFSRFASKSLLTSAPPLALRQCSLPWACPALAMKLAVALMPRAMCFSTVLG